MLEAKELTKKYKAVTAVNQVSLVLNKGESVGLLGPNGAGKSTTISMLSTLLPPSSGQVFFEGNDALKQPQKLRKVLGVVPQEIALYEELSAYENLKFFGKVYGLKGERLATRIDEVLELIGLTERKKEALKTYSGGMKRRINIGVTLLHEPEVLIMDEPTVGIDPQSRNYILEMIRNLNKNQNITVLYTSHYMEEVEKLCDRIYIMDHGDIIADGTNEELKGILSEEETIQIGVSQLSPAFEEALSRHQAISKVTEGGSGYKVIAPKGTDLLGDIFELAKSTGTHIVNLAVLTPTLEDVFLHLTGRTLRD
ncbi:MAG: ABC transporter ATP-binding protein [Alkalibacterium sp.]|nr:ABC transporter ATP-binding protein [Alkalibacterium sp.]